MQKYSVFDFFRSFDANHESHSLEIFEAADGQENVLLPRFHPQALDRNVQWNPKLIDRAGQLKDRVRFGLNNVLFDPRRIEPGKLADLVVLGGDFLAAPDDQIASIPVEMTMVGGTVVHEQGSPKPASVRNSFLALLGGRRLITARC